MPNDPTTGVGTGSFGGYPWPPDVLAWRTEALGAGHCVGVAPSRRSGLSPAWLPPSITTLSLTRS
jgi:hypothetical protein